jgi:hypothetical protein
VDLEVMSALVAMWVIHLVSDVVAVSLVRGSGLRPGVCGIDRR